MSRASRQVRCTPEFTDHVSSDADWNLVQLSPRFLLPPTFAAVMVEPPCWARLGHASGPENRTEAVPDEFRPITVRHQPDAARSFGAIRQTGRSVASAIHGGRRETTHAQPHVPVVPLPELPPLLRWNLRIEHRHLATDHGSVLGRPPEDRQRAGFGRARRRPVGPDARPRGLGGRAQRSYGQAQAGAANPVRRRSASRAARLVSGDRAGVVAGHLRPCRTARRDQRHRQPGAARLRPPTRSREPDRQRHGAQHVGHDLDPHRRTRRSAGCWSTTSGQPGA